MRVSDFATFIKRRERHRQNKEMGTRLKPDPIIQQFRFCNVRRNDDRVTRWIHENMLHPWADQTHVWFAMIVARLFNQPETLKELMEGQCIIPFKQQKMRKMLRARAERGEKVFNAAYIVSTNGRAMNKVDYVCDIVLAQIWSLRGNITLALKDATLEQMHETLQGCSGLGSFMAAQVVADLKYVEPWHGAADFHTFAASGPGSKRGLNRVCDRDLKKPWKEDQFRETLGNLRLLTNKRLGWEEPLTAQDIQNCLCEFDKYERARLGEGRPKQHYRPHEEN